MTYEEFREANEARQRLNQAKNWLVAYNAAKSLEKFLQSANASKWTQDYVRGMRRRLGGVVLGLAEDMARGDGDERTSRWFARGFDPADEIADGESHTEARNEEA